jgi:hypothetical protein
MLTLYVTIDRQSLITRHDRIRRRDKQFGCENNSTARFDQHADGTSLVHAYSARGAYYWHLGTIPPQYYLTINLKNNDIQELLQKHSRRRQPCDRLNAFAEVPECHYF